MTDSVARADDADYDDPGQDEQGAALLDLAVNTLAGGVTGVAGYAVGGPAGAVVGNAATPYLAAVFRKVVRPFWQDRSRRAEKMLEAAAESAGLTPEELSDRAAESEESRFLTDKAVRAATATIWPEGVRAIGRAYAAGLLAQDAPTLNIRLRVLGIMEDLDETHVVLLELLVRYQPDTRYGATNAMPHRFPSYREAHWKQIPGIERQVWSVGERIWPTQRIIHEKPRLREVLASLLGELRASGLIEENDTAPATAKRLSDDLARQINRQAEERQHGGPPTPVTIEHTTIQAPEPSWSPTELGEKILGFYAEAGAEDIQAPGVDPGQEAGDS